MIDAQKITSSLSARYFNSFCLYFFPKKLLSLAKRTTARAATQEKALISDRGRTVKFVAKLNADLALFGSKVPFSLKPAVLLSKLIR